VIPEPLRNATLPFLGGTGAGFALALSLLFAPSAQLEPAMREALLLYQDALTDLERYYVDDLDAKKLTSTALQAMLGSLDPYSSMQKAEQLREQVSGRYGGVGLVIAEPLRVSDGPSPATVRSKGRGGLGAAPGADEAAQPKGSPTAGTTRTEDSAVVVLNAFEGYAFDAGMRVGDRIVAVDGTPTAGLSLDDVRDMLRGAPDTKVALRVARDVLKSGPKGEEFDITLDRRVVKMDDVRVATLWGRKEEGIAYVQLTNFGETAAREVAQSLLRLESAAPEGLKGIVLDLRGNPGGLLTSAVEVSSLFVPKDSTIVTAEGRAFNPVRYKSISEPLRPINLPLVVLVNSGTASAAEIVSGAVQDLDAGVIVGIGDGRTFGKGLVQEVEELEGGESMKYTIAKYYTPSGRCIQSDNYKSASAKVKPTPSEQADKALSPDAGTAGEPLSRGAPSRGFTSTKVADDEKKTFQTRTGRSVRDGGGIEADVKVANPPLAPLTSALISQGAVFDFTSEWTRHHEFSSYGNSGTPNVLKEFEEFVKRREKAGLLKLDAVVPQLSEIEAGLRDAKLTASAAEVGNLRKALRQELWSGFKKEHDELRFTLQEAITSRYLPEGMLQRYRLNEDTQFQKALDILRTRGMYDSLLQGAAADSSQS